MIQKVKGGSQITGPDTTRDEAVRIARRRSLHRGGPRGGQRRRAQHRRRRGRGGGLLRGRRRRRRGGHGRRGGGGSGGGERTVMMRSSGHDGMAGCCAGWEEKKRWKEMEVSVKKRTRMFAKKKTGQEEREGRWRWRWCSAVWFSSCGRPREGGDEGRRSEEYSLNLIVNVRLCQSKASFGILGNEQQATSFFLATCRLLTFFHYYHFMIWQ